MRTRETDPAAANGGVGAAIKQVSDHAKSLVSLEIELAKTEVARKVASLGVGVGLLVGAALFGALALGFTFATVAAALATFFDTWLALLIVTLFLFLLAGILGLVGAKRLQAPVPQQAIREAKLTTAALKGNGGN